MSKKNVQIDTDDGVIIGLIFLDNRTGSSAFLWLPRLGNALFSTSPARLIAESTVLFYYLCYIILIIKNN